MRTLLKFIAANLDFLFGDNAFKLINSQSNGEDGDALLELKNDKLLIQLIRDRGQFEIYFANNIFPNELFELSEIIEIMEGIKPTYNSSDNSSVFFLKNNFNSITELLINHHNTALHKRDKIREKELAALGYKKN